MTIKMLKKRPDYLVRYENRIYFFCQDDANVCFASLELDSHKLLWLIEGKEYDINIDVGGLILKDKENGGRPRLVEELTWCRPYILLKKCTTFNKKVLKKCTRKKWK